MQSESDAPVRELDGPEYIEVDGQLVPNYDLTFPSFEEGDVVSGRVVRIDKDEVLVDIGYKSEGVIPSNELSIRKSVNPADEVELNEVVDALVLQKEDQDGRLILSKKRARFERAWKRIEEAANNSEMVTGKVIEVVKGGLILDLGVRGFLPASLVDIRRVQDLDEFLGKELECKVIELNRSRNNVVLSRRAVIEDERREVRQKILDELQPGAVVEGVISNIVDFGAFVDLEGIDGLIHISELSWTHVNHPSEVLAIGDRVEVKVLDIDRDRQRISLGLKQTQADPWQSVVEAYQVGDVVAGKVTKVVTFGAFVEIHAGVEGLVHISELAEHHVENPREVVAPDQEVAVRIIEIDGERRRLSLSLKRAAEVSLDGEDQEIPAYPDEAEISAALSEESGAGEAVAESWPTRRRRRSPPSRSLRNRLPRNRLPPSRLPRSRWRPSRWRWRLPPRSRRWRRLPSRSPRRRSTRRPRRPRTPTHRNLPTGNPSTHEPAPPRSLGLTGGIGSGKSVALEAFRRLGAAVLSSDEVVHRIYDDPEVRAAVRERLRRAGRSAATARSTGRRCRVSHSRSPTAWRSSRGSCTRASAVRARHGRRSNAVTTRRRRSWCARCPCSSRLASRTPSTRCSWSRRRTRCDGRVSRPAGRTSPREAPASSTRRRRYAGRTATL